MARPKKEKTLDRRVSVRLSDETYVAYERIAAAFDVPVGQLIRQILTLEAGELGVLVSALQRHSQGDRFGTLPRPVGVSEREFVTQLRRGGFTERLRQEAFNLVQKDHPKQDTETPARPLSR